MFFPDFSSGVTLGIGLAIAGTSCAVIAFAKLRKQKAQRIKEIRERNKERVTPEGNFDAFVTPGGFKPSPRKMTSLSEDRREAERLRHNDGSASVTSPLASIIDVPLTADHEKRNSGGRSIGSDYDSGSSYSSGYSSSSDSSSSSSDSGGGGGGD